MNSRAPARISRRWTVRSEFDPLALSLHRFRLELGLSAQKLADASGLSLARISNNELGRSATVATLIDHIGGLGATLELRLCDLRPGRSFRDQAVRSLSLHSSVELLGQLREAAALSLVEAAERVGVSPQVLKRQEADPKVSVPTLFGLGTRLGFDVTAWARLGE